MSPDLAHVRRLEAVSFRSFPATKTHYDGTWAIRMTAGHPAKRLNSVNPLDPADNADIEHRIELAGRRFSAFGRPLFFRLTPLAPTTLEDRFKAARWSSFDESVVMSCNLGDFDHKGVQSQLPLQDMGRWVDAYIEMSEESASLKPGLVEVLDSTEPATGLFLHSDGNGKSLSAVRCVVDRDLAGIFDLVTAPAHRGCGHSVTVFASALEWAKRQGASHAWLQVVVDNNAAMALYRRMGFEEVYRYRYWKPDQGPD